MNLRREIRRVRGCGARAHVQHRLLDAACLIANHCSIVTLHRGHSALSATQCNAKFAPRSTRQKQYVDRLPCYIQYGRRSVRVASTILYLHAEISTCAYPSGIPTDIVDSSCLLFEFLGLVFNLELFKREIISEDFPSGNMRFREDYWLNFSVVFVSENSKAHTRSVKLQSIV